MPIPYTPGEALTCQQIRELDVLAIEHVGIPGIVLMENAGRGTAEFIYGLLVDPAAGRVAILCGPGNNGGDGFVVARHLYNAGVAVDVVLAAAPEKSQGDAGTNLAIIERMGLGLIRASTPVGMDAARRAVAGADVVVDALL
ncbi:MAG: NAD(P)H-hydrate epimerase, partial [Planctomycetota bacterium]